MPLSVVTGHKTNLLRDGCRGPGPGWRPVKLGMAAKGPSGLRQTDEVVQGLVEVRGVEWSDPPLARHLEEIMSDSLGLSRPVGQFQLAPLALTYLRNSSLTPLLPSTPASTYKVSLSLYESAPLFRPVRGASQLFNLR